MESAKWQQFCLSLNVLQIGEIWLAPQESNSQFKDTIFKHIEQLLSKMPTFNFQNA